VKGSEAEIKLLEAVENLGMPERSTEGTGFQ